MKQTAAKGHTTKHAKAAKTKHSKTAKHHPATAHKTAATTTKAKVHTKAKHPAHAKARQLAQADAPVRAARLRLPADGRVDGAAAWADLADVACCSALAVAASARLAGWPVGAADVLALYKLTADGPDAGASLLATLDAAYLFGLAGVRPVSFGAVDPEEALGRDGLLLGLELPGPHAVLAETGRWWSWSQPWPPAAFPDAVIEEAWAVVWP